MKRLLLLSVFATGSLYAELPPDGVNDFRVNNNSDAKFSDAASWNEYRTPVIDWTAISLDVLPWELTTVYTPPVNLKADESIVTSDTAIGTADNPLTNIRVYGFWNSTLNITADFHITDEITQEGGGNMDLNISNGASVSLRRINQVDRINISGSGTNVTLKDDTSFSKVTNITSGSTLSIINGKNIYIESDEGVFNATNATINGTIETRNGASATFTNSTFNAGPHNESIKSGGKMSFTMDGSVYNNYYTGWDPFKTTSSWNGNVMFIGLGGDSEQTFTFKNGTIINGAGAADGTSFWDMDPATRTRADITDGGGFNLGWNAMSNATDFLTVNIESGTKVAATNIHMGNNNVPDSTTGKITWNQSGTNLTNGYTEVHLKDGITMALSRASSGMNDFKTEMNFGGYTLLDAGGFTIGSDETLGGSAVVNITKSNNTIKVAGLSINTGTSSSGSNAKASILFADTSSNSTLTVNGNVDIHLGTAGMVDFRIAGTNNAVEVSGDFNLVNTALSGTMSADFSMTGVGNRLTVNNFNTSNGDRQDGATSGSISAFFKGGSATDKNAVEILSGEMILQGSQAYGSTASLKMEFAGNTILRGGANADKGVWLKINEWGGKNYTSSATFTVRGSGNDLLLSGLEIGKDTTDGGGDGVFKIVGGDSSIVINDGGAGRNGFKIDRGGVLSYSINNSGITAIKNYAWNGSDFNGKLEVSFLDIIGEVDTKYVLYMTVDGALRDRLHNWFEDMSDESDLKAADEFISVLLRDPNNDIYRFALEDIVDEDTGQTLLSLVIYYTSTVPEPAAYAALFGLVALIASARRRKRK